MKMLVIFKNGRGDTVREYEYTKLPESIPQIGDKILIKKNVGTVESRVISYDDNCISIIAR